VQIQEIKMNRIVFFINISLIVISVNLYSQKIDSICGTRCTRVLKKLKYFKFTKKKYQKKLKYVWEIIDTNAVYLRYIEPDTLFETMGKYEFLRFFGNGIVFESCAYSTEPSEENFNDLCYGFSLTSIFTYYDNEIIIEEWGYDYFVFWGYKYFRISNDKDSLILYKIKEGRVFPKFKFLESPSKVVYVKKKVPLYNFKWWEHSNPKDLRIPWKERENRKMERRLRKEKKEQ